MIHFHIKVPLYSKTSDELGIQLSTKVSGPESLCAFDGKTGESTSDKPCFAVMFEVLESVVLKFIYIYDRGLVSSRPHHLYQPILLEICIPI